MSDTRKILVAIAIAAGAICAAVVWLGLQVRALSDAQSPGPSTPASTAPSGTARYRLETTPGELSRLGYQEFYKHWETDAYHRAEELCFRPLVAKGVEPDPAPHLFVTLAGDGTVSDVRWPNPPPDQQELYPCLASIIREIRFEPTGAVRSGEVQAHRPGAFREPDPASTGTSRADRPKTPNDLRAE